MPPRLLIYKDKDFKQIHDFMIGETRTYADGTVLRGLVHAGSTRTEPIFLKNVGDGTLYDVTVEIYVNGKKDTSGSVTAKLSPNPPQLLKPNQTYTGMLEVNVKEKAFGAQEIVVRIAGLHVD